MPGFTKPCPECGQQVSIYIAACKHCGAANPNQKPHPRLGKAMPRKPKPAVAEDTAAEEAVAETPLKVVDDEARTWLRTEYESPPEAPAQPSGDYVVTRGSQCIIGDTTVILRTGQVIRDEQLIKRLLHVHAPIKPREEVGAMHTCPYCHRAFSEDQETSAA